MKARSAECKHISPANEQERYRMQMKAYKDDGFFTLTKKQKAKLSKDDFEVIERLGNALYGKGCK